MLAHHVKIWYYTGCSVIGMFGGPKYNGAEGLEFTMRKHVLFPFFALIMGIAGAFIRASELSRAFEPGTGLQIPGETASSAMQLFSAAAIVIFAVFAALQRGRLKEGLRIFGGEKNTASQVLAAAAAIMLIAAACFEFAMDREGLPLSRLIQILLALFAAVSIIIRITKQGKEYAFFSLVPIFWCCFWLFCSSARFRCSASPMMIRLPCSRRRP
jgi:asparagine N-glycosylation enzyme membrane subunit Stt3